MRLIISPEAADDLRTIGAHIAEDNPLRARSFVAELQTACHQLLQMPRAFPVVASHDNAALHRRAFKGYLIFYRAGEDRLEIVRIIHSARDHMRLLFDPQDSP